MSPHARFAFVLFALAAFALAGCGATVSTVEAPQEQVMGKEVVEEAPQAEPELEEPMAEEAAAPQATAGAGFDWPVSTGSDRLIIKNAEMRLLVADSGVAIDRLTQVVGDLGGYIISSREWLVEQYGQNYKHATITFAVPVSQFERALGRLRAIALDVLDEKASGEDVTQEYVDLESRLRNLEATRDRILTFLEDAETVEEALRINQELSDVEDQIEEIKGRMNYLSGRAAFSTITVTIEPDIPDVTPTPTATATATPTPTPTATPTPWDPGKTFAQASSTLASAYRGIVNVIIWLGVVFVPIVGPFALLGWGVWRFTRRGQTVSPEKAPKED